MLGSLVCLWKSAIWNRGKRAHVLHMTMYPCAVVKHVLSKNEQRLRYHSSMLFLNQNTT